jgi:DNA-binding CsgD family transcriptional regulator
MLPSTAWALRQALQVDVDPASTDLLGSRFDEAVDGLGEDGPEAALHAIVNAERARNGTTERWRDAVVQADEGLIPCRLRHYARYRLAQSLISDGDRAEAAELLSEVVNDAPEDGVRRVARWARELAARSEIVLAIAGAPRGNSESRTAGAGVGSLTPRELQVLALVAQGFTNPQIGQQLFISPKTASVHVSAILVKIGAANRTEAAALYATSGLS